MTINSKFLLLSLLSVSFNVFSMGSSMPKQSPVPNHRWPKSGAPTLYLQRGLAPLRSCDNVITLSKKLKGSVVTNVKGFCVWDLKGGILDGKNQKGDQSQNEYQEQLLSDRTPLNIKNGFVTNNKDAMNFTAPKSGVIKMTWLNVGEDAVSTSRGAQNFTIEDCEFINKKSGDKSIQMNEAEGLRMFNNLIYSGITCARIGDSGINKPSDTAYVGGNKFVSCDTAYNISSITVRSEKKDSYENVRLEKKFDNGGSFK